MEAIDEAQFGEIAHGALDGQERDAQAVAKFGVGGQLIAAA
jgi:hypothetical protein